MDVKGITPQHLQTTQQSAGSVKFQPPAAQLPVTQQLPTTSVSISPELKVTEIPDSYLRPRLTEQYHTREAAADRSTAMGQLDHRLNRELDRYETVKIFRASPFLEGLGKLASETSEYSNESRSFMLAADAVERGYEPKFDNELRDVTSSVELTVRTKEGDVVTISLSQNTDVVQNGLSFSFEVEGELSEDEQKMLDELGARLAETADGYFETGKARLDNFEDFDTSELGSFKVAFSNTETDYPGTVTYEMAIDHTEETRTLKGENQDGYTFEIITKLDQKFELEILERNDQFKQYLALIGSTTDAYKADTEVQRFMENGFLTALGLGSDIHKPSNPSETANSRRMQLFHSGMPDFKAAFHSTIQTNPLDITEQAFMSLKMEQVTSVEEWITDAGEHAKMSQVSRYDQVVKTFAGISGAGSPDFERGYYSHNTLKVSEENGRHLEMLDGRVEKLEVEHQKSRETEKKVYHDFKLEEHDQYSFSDSEILDLLDGVNTEDKTAADRRKVDQLLEGNNYDLFVYH